MKGDRRDADDAGVRVEERLDRLDRRQSGDAALYSASRNPLPRGVVRWEFQRRGDHVVARLPPIPLGDERQPFGRVLENGDLGRLCSDQPSCRSAKRIVLRVPLAPVQRAVLALIARVALHRLVRTRRERAHCRVVEVDEVPRHREMFANHLLFHAYNPIMNHPMVLALVSAVWVASEIAVGVITRRSGAGASRQDRGSLMFLWMLLGPTML